MKFVNDLIIWVKDNPRSTSYVAGVLSVLIIKYLL